MEKYTAIKERAAKYTQMLAQVVRFRERWDVELKQFIKEHIEKILKETGLDAQVEVEDSLSGLEAITVRLGRKTSGIIQALEDGTPKHLVKDFGTLAYSQLFNGKVQVWMTHPMIEGLMEPRPPKLIGIYAPPEFNEDLMLTTFDTFLKELVEWEDYDDDQPTNKIGFGVSTDVAQPD